MGMLFGIPCIYVHVVYFIIYNVILAKNEFLKISMTFMYFYVFRLISNLSGHCFIAQQIFMTMKKLIFHIEIVFATVYDNCLCIYFCMQNCIILKFFTF